MTNTKMKMPPFDAASPTELYGILRTNIDRVPLRGHRQGRARKELSEKSIVCHFLASIAKTNLLEFPVGVEPSERPDLVLKMRSGHIGIEITEAVHNDKARVDAYSSENEETENLRPIPRYRVNDPSRTKAEIEKIAKGQIKNTPLMGDSMEHDWAEAMIHFIKRKAAGFQKSGFTKHSKNWLLIYDNWSPAPSEHEFATKILDRHIFALNANNPFCRVFVQGCCNIWGFTNKMGVVRYPIPMDWCTP